MEDWLNYAVPLLDGAWITLQLTIYSTILGGIVSFMAGVGRLSSNKLISWFSICFIEFFVAPRFWYNYFGCILRYRFSVKPSALIYVCRPCLPGPLRLV